MSLSSDLDDEEEPSDDSMAGSEERKILLKVSGDLIILVKSPGDPW